MLEETIAPAYMPAYQLSANMQRLLRWQSNERHRHVRTHLRSGGLSKPLIGQRAHSCALLGLDHQP